MSRVVRACPSSSFFRELRETDGYLHARSFFFIRCVLSSRFIFFSQFKGFKESPGTGGGVEAGADKVRREGMAFARTMP